MIEKNEESFSKKVKENDYNTNIKRKMLTITLPVEFNMLFNFIKEGKTFKTFFRREMHGIMYSYRKEKKSYYQNKEEFLVIFPKNKGENLEINDFMINNIKSNNIYMKNYVYKVSLLFLESWENYKKILFRLLLQNEDKQNRANLKNEIVSKNDAVNYIDSTVSFYLDINDNSTVILNEYKYDLNENVFLRYYDINKIFYKKLQNFITKNFNNYICNESILINRSMNQLLNYIMSRKLFYTKRIILKKMQKCKDEINIYIDIKDKIYPDSVYQTRCHILKISNISCFVSVVSLIDVKHFSLNKRFLTLKACISLVLKLIKKNVEKEIIES